MENAILEGFDLFICVFDEYMFYMFCDSFIQNKLINKKYRYGVVAATALLIYAVNQLDSSLINLISVFVLHTFICIYLYRGKIKKKLFFALLGCILLSLAEFVLICIAKLGERIYLLNIVDDIGKRFFAILIAKLCAFMVIKTTCRCSVSSKSEFLASESKYFYFLPCACLILFIGIDYSDFNFTFSDYGSMLVLLGCLLLLICVGVLFVIYEKMTSIILRVKDYEVLTVKNHLEKEHYARLEEINHGHRKLLHSINDYVVTIKALALENHCKDIIKITDDFDAHVIELKEANYCDDAIINAILKEKEWEATRLNVRFEAFVEQWFTLPNLFVIDLISVLSNTLNNAIEAASGREDGFIRAQLYKANDGKFSIIKIKNNYTKEPVMENGVYITQKEDPESHGIGLNHTQALVEKYEGIMETRVVNEEFIVTLMFFI